MTSERCTIKKTSRTTLKRGAPQIRAQNGPRALPTIGGGGLLTYFPTVVPDSKTDKTPKYHIFGGGGEILSKCCHRFATYRAIR